MRKLIIDSARMRYSMCWGLFSSSDAQHTCFSIIPGWLYSLTTTVGCLFCRRHVSQLITVGKSSSTIYHIWFWTITSNWLGFRFRIRQFHSNSIGIRSRKSDSQGIPRCDECVCYGRRRRYIIGVRPSGAVVALPATTSRDKWMGSHEGVDIQYVDIVCMISWFRGLSLG